MKRPSVRELNRRIAAAKEAIEDGKCKFVSRGKAFGELTDLDVSTEEVWELISVCLEEIGPENYDGGRPPEKAYEKRIRGKDLFPFAWKSDYLKKKMYLKFVISNDCFWYVSFHESRYK